MRRLILAALCSALLALAPAAPVLATIAAPGAMSIVSCMAFESDAETGDLTIIFEANIQYTSPPSTPSSEAFMFRLLHDGAQIASRSPVTFASFNTTYGHLIGSFYFNAATSPGTDNLTLNITGQPGYFVSVPESSHPIVTEEIASTTNSTEAQLAIYNYVIGLCHEFETYYPTVVLYGTSDSGKVVLSSYGEQYLGAAIPGLQILAPTLYTYQTYTPTTLPVTPYDMSLQTINTNRLHGTDLMIGFNRLGVIFGGVSGAFVAGILTFVGCIAIYIWFKVMTWGFEPALFVCMGVTVFMAWLIGSMVFTMTMIIALLCAVLLMYAVAFRRA